MSRLNAAHNLMKRLVIARLFSDTRANVSIIFAIAIVPIVFGLGAVADYSMAAQRRAHINALADAAALSAVSSASMTKTSDVAQQQAINFFNAQLSNMSGIVYNPNVNIQVKDTTTINGTLRTAVVPYSIQSVTMFGGILGVKTITVAGSATASATSAANINFYLLVDTSPSMTIAATASGISTMVANTTSQGGCAFACHETHPSSDNLGNPGGEDNYALAQHLGVALRMDLVTQAVTNMIATAQSTAQNTKAAYQIGVYTFDIAVNNPVPLTSNFATAKTQAASIAPLEVYNNNCYTSTNCNSDMDTNFDLAFSTLYQAMPNPGNGTNVASDTPQEVLFIVTDGVSDEKYLGNRIYTPFGSDPLWCDKIKSRGIRIAVLYTTYNPLPTNAWYNTYISGEQTSIAKTAQSCASSGLYYEVSTDGDISGALNNLFRNTIASAHLTQ